MPLAEPIFAHDLREKILSEYIESLSSAGRILKIPLPLVSYSEPELRGALDEADIDLKAMFERRSKAKGISPGKIAGILAYRLSRFKIIHIEESGHPIRGAHMLQDVAALLLVEHLILKTLPGSHAAGTGPIGWLAATPIRKPWAWCSTCC